MEEKYYNKTIEEVERDLNTNCMTGLKTEEIEARQAKVGYNEIQSIKKKKIIVKFFEQFKDFMIIILIISAVVSAIVGVYNGEGFTDTIIILIVVIINAVIGVIQEERAEKSLEALQKLSSHTAKVVRNGKQYILPARELVPGDLVIIETGDYIPADLRIVEAINLKTQESALTGESLPVEKMIEKVDKRDVELGDRVNIAYSSTLVTYGRGAGIVIATGMKTEVGKIAQMINDTEKEETPLQKKLNGLGKILGITALAICVIIFVLGLIYGKKPLDMFMIAVSLAVAAIPEGLATVSTIVLAFGVQRMVKKNAIVKHLPAVETLGSTTVICTDKTGTLTQNKMTVKKIFVNRRLENINKYIGKDEKETLSGVLVNDELRKLTYISMLCNDTKIDVQGKLTGDPTETALIDMGFSIGYDPSKYGQYPRVGEIPFDSERKLMTIVSQRLNKFYIDTKGGVDEILEKCDRYIENGEIKPLTEEIKNEIKTINEQMAKEALRVLAMAYEIIDHIPNKDELAGLENELIYVGMVGMIDPPREEVKDSIIKCKNAGIKTVMITGDHKTTAVAIAKELGIFEEGDIAITGSDLLKMSDEELIKNVRNIKVYARVSPEHKVRIVKAWQSYGEIVAMTGDGVNDAPALKTANIGCAMGKVGTDVAKEAADVILTDDNFSTIVSAVEEGRRIYDNILKVIQFLLSSNIGEIVVMLLAIVFAPLISTKFNIDIKLIQIFVVVQLLWINLVTDSLPALGLSVDPAEKNIMKRKPLRTKGIFTKGMIWRIIYQGITIGSITLIAFILGLSISDIEAQGLINQNSHLSGMTLESVKVEVGQTMAFIVLGFSELVHIFNVRSNKESIFKSIFKKNMWLIFAEIITAALMLSVIMIPEIRKIFELVMLPQSLYLECILLIFTPVLIVEVMKLFKINASKDE